MTQGYITLRTGLVFGSFLKWTAAPDAAVRQFTLQAARKQMFSVVS